MDVLLHSYQKDLKQNCKKSSAKIANPPKTATYKHMGISESDASDWHDLFLLCMFHFPWDGAGHMLPGFLSDLLARTFWSSEHNGLGWWQLFLLYGCGMRRRHKNKCNLYMLLGAKHLSLKVLSTMVSSNLVSKSTTIDFLLSSLMMTDWLGKRALGSVPTTPDPDISARASWFIREVHVTHMGGVYTDSNQ